MPVRSRTFRIGSSTTADSGRRASTAWRIFLKNFKRKRRNMGARNERQNEAADREIVITRVVDAPRELVWEAMTDPWHVIHWWGPRGFTTTVETMEVRTGGVWKLVMHGPDGTNYPN